MARDRGHSLLWLARFCKTGAKCAPHRRRLRGISRVLAQYSRRHTRRPAEASPNMPRWAPNRRRSEEYAQPASSWPSKLLCVGRGVPWMEITCFISTPTRSPPRTPLFSILTKSQKITPLFPTHTLKTSKLRATKSDPYHMIGAVCPIRAASCAQTGAKRSCPTRWPEGAQRRAQGGSSLSPNRTPVGDPG